MRQCQHVEICQNTYVNVNVALTGSLGLIVPHPKKISTYPVYTQGDSFMYMPVTIVTDVAPCEK